MSTAHQSDWIADLTATLPHILTVDEVCAALRTSPRNLRRMVATGRIRGLRARESGSSRRLFPRAEVERYLRACAGEL
jgi:excisionase family DNA binding protein